MSLRSSTSARRKTKKARLRNWDASRGRPFEGDVPAGIRSTMRVCVARYTVERRKHPRLDVGSFTTCPYIQMYAGDTVHRQVPHKSIGARLRGGERPKIV